MQEHKAPPFRNRLFKVLIVTTAITTCIVSAIISTLEIAETRHGVIQNIRHDISLIADITAMGIKDKNSDKLSELAKLFPHPQGLNILCIYNQENALIKSWQADSYHQSCPAIIREIGVNASLFTLRIAEPINSENTYLGIVYADAVLLSAKSMVLRISVVFVSLLLVTLFACAVAAHYGSRNFKLLIDAIRQQIECLKNNTSECQLSPGMATSETTVLFNAIQSLRIHLMASIVPKETVVHLHKWYENIFFNLFLLLRHRISSDSILLPLLSDCELLLRLNAQESAPEAEIVDITHLVDEGLASARALNPPGNQVHLVVSCKPGLIKEWKVQPGYIKALVRHLLLIGLARTNKGLISLRLEVVMQPQKGKAMLVWRLEDSGLPVQPGVLHSRLVDMQYKIVSVAEASWLLVVQLTKSLGGSLQGENTLGGLLLRGDIPLEYAEQYINPNAAHRHSECPRLVLFVGDSSRESQTLCNLLKQFDCNVFWAANHIQALELAPSLPFSAIILNASLFSHDGNAAVRRLRALMENKLMPTIPLWAVTASEASAEHKEWNDMGVSQVLIAPVNQIKLASLCQQLSAFDAQFWASCDMTLLQEFSNATMARLPQMRAEILDQIQGVYTVISGVQKAFTSEVVHKVHAVKSAALALGYMRLALLMANLELMLNAKQIDNVSDNIAIIAECLKNITLQK